MDNRFIHAIGITELRYRMSSIVLTKTDFIGRSRKETMVYARSLLTGGVDSVYTHVNTAGKQCGLIVAGTAATAVNGILDRALTFYGLMTPAVPPTGTGTGTGTTPAKKQSAAVKSELTFECGLPPVNTLTFRIKGVSGTIEYSITPNSWLVPGGFMTTLGSRLVALATGFNSYLNAKTLTGIVETMNGVPVDVGYMYEVDVPESTTPAKTIPAHKLADGTDVPESIIAAVIVPAHKAILKSPSTDLTTASRDIFAQLNSDDITMGAVKRGVVPVNGSQLDRMEWLIPPVPPVPTTPPVDVKTGDNAPVNDVKSIHVDVKPLVVDVNGVPVK